MRPDSSQDPSVEPMEEPADVGSFVILSPTPYERIQLLNQLLGGQRQLPPCPLSHLIHETTNRLRFGIRVKRSRTSSATNLAFGQTTRIGTCLGRGSGKRSWIGGLRLGVC